jgi:hypothetical protein
MSDFKILVIDKDKGGEKQYQTLDDRHIVLVFTSEYITYKAWSNGGWAIISRALRDQKFDLIFFTMGSTPFMEEDPSFEEMINSLLASSGLFVTPSDAPVFTKSADHWVRKTALFSNILFKPETKIGECIEMYYLCRREDRAAMAKIDRLPGVWGDNQSQKWQQLKNGG